jgi:isopropylmalate/homocitrate/citramalate synthase
MTALPRRVTIVEVGPRDGLQNEASVVPTSAKVAFVDALSAAGHSAIEVSAFVSPKWVPQMADAAEVFAGITRRPDVRYSALVPNLAGLTRAEAAGARHIAVFAAASETFSKRNINQSIDESLETYRSVVAAAHERRIPVRGYLSTCFGCPFEGHVPPSTVADVASRLFEIGVWQVAISDTIGVAHPAQVTEVLDAVTRQLPLQALALHLHDTRGTALANVLAGLQYGVATFDSAAGGLGGCPYAPGASGNLATEDLLYMLDGMGIETGVSLAGVVAASRALAPSIAHPLPSKYLQAVGS